MEKVDDWEKLIDDEIEVIKSKGVLNGEYNKEMIVKQAC